VQTTVYVGFPFGEIDVTFQTMFVDSIPNGG
jgi:hypothetical protein